MKIIKTYNTISDIIRTQLPEEDYGITTAATHYEGILVRSAELKNEVFPPELLAIARAGAGTNNIPVDRCTAEGIVVFNTPGANANAVKELVLCGMLLAGRRVVAGANWLREVAVTEKDSLEQQVEAGKKQFAGPELKGKTLGVIGLGAIGIMVANAADSTLGMQVMGYDPYLSVDAAWSLNRSIRHVKHIDELYAACDYITVHVPLNDKTRHSFDAAVFSKMKPGAVLLNFARGPLVDEEAVLAALDAGTLRRYVTDFPTERLLAHDKVLATPHLGASTPESEENCAEMAARELREYLENGNILNAVNFPRCEMMRGDGIRLAIINRNIANMVGQITALLAAEQHNIEHMVNAGRGEYAYTLIDIATQPSPACLDALMAIDGVVRVRVL